MKLPMKAEKELRKSLKKRKKALSKSADKMQEKWMTVEEKVDPMLTDIKSFANSAKNSVQKVANDGLETVKFESARAMRKIKGEGVDNGEIGALSAEEGQIDGRARRIEREVDPIER